jgi:CheY-like chemotaxis protein
LTIISGYTQMLLVSPHVTTERDRTALEQVLRASERAADLTSQLLAFSRRQTIQPRVIEINRVVDQTVSMLRRLIGEDIELRIDKAADAGRIHADAAQIQQVLLNLVINARDAMPAGGTLIIRTHNADFAPGPNPRQHAKRGGYVVLEIADTGTGMDSATRQRIFEPFFTTKPEGKGTGLGLSTVYAIVKQAKGLIDFNTVVSEGTTFRVYLPRVRNELVEEPAANLEPAGGHETVLLVEDEEGVRRAVHSALERRGYHVLVAASGPEALDLSRSHQGPIDLLISDVVMPQMNGRELAKTLTGERPHIAVMFISGYPGDTLQSKGALAAEAVFLPKPFTPAALTTMVRQILDRRGKGRESTHNHGV